MTDRTVTATLRLKAGEFVGGIGTSMRAVRQFRGELDQMSRTSPQRLNQTSTAIGTMGAALLGVTGYLVKMSAEFDRQMSQVAGVTKASGRELNALRHAALQAGRDTQFSATQAAEAETELAKAGLNSAQIMGGALRGSLALAAAGQMELADAATVAAQAMNVFDLQGKDVGHIADVLAGGANTSAASMHSLGDALRQGGQVAAQTGLSLEDTVGTLAAFADRALIGSDAGTSLKTMLQHLANPTEQSADLMRQLGIHAYDVQGNFVGITSVAGQLQTALSGLSQAQRDQALAQIFGSDAVRAANVLYGLGEQGLRRYVGAVNQAGAAQAMAQTSTDNLIGDLERLRGAVETLTIESGKGANSGLRDLTQAAERLVDSVSMLPAPMQETLVVVAGLSGAALLGAAAWLKLRTKMAETLATLSETGPAGTRAAAGISRVTAVAGRLTATLVALQIASAALGDDASAPVGKAAKALAEFGKTGKTTDDVLRHLDYDLQSLGSGALDKFGNSVAGVIEGLTGTGSVFDESLTHARQRIESIDQGLTDLVQSGHSDEAAAAFERLKKAAKDAGISVDDLRKGLPGYTAALDGANAVQVKNIQVTEEQHRALTMLAGTLADAVGQAGSLAKVFDDLNGKSLTNLDTTMAAEQAIDDLSEALKGSQRTLDLNSQAGRDNTKAIEQVITAARDAAQAVYDQTGSVDLANAAYQGYINRLHDTMRAAGYTEAQIQALIRAYAKLPPAVSTRVVTPGLATAISQAKSLDALLRSLNGTVARASVVTTYYANQTGFRPSSGYRGAVPQRWGGALEHAQAGLLREAQVYPAGSGPLYAFAEPATRGEAFIPRAGDRDRSLSILSRAAGWYGAEVTHPNRRFVSAAAPPAPAVSSRVDGEVIGREVRKALRGVTVVMDGHAVGTLVGREQGLQADRYRRGG